MCIAKHPQIHLAYVRSMHEYHTHYIHIFHQEIERAVYQMYSYMCEGSITPKNWTEFFAFYLLFMDTCDAIQNGNMTKHTL